MSKKTEAELYQEAQEQEALSKKLGATGPDPNLNSRTEQEAREARSRRMGASSGHDEPEVEQKPQAMVAIEGMLASKNA